MEYVSFNEENWTGRKDIEDGISGLRIHQIIEPYVGQFKSKVFFGFGSDVGVKRNKGRVGARNAPDEIRKALSNLPIHFSNLDIFDAGTVFVEGDLEAARLLQISKVQSILSTESLPLVLGGGHETALGNFLAFIEEYPEDSLIINLDAHFDIRLPNPESTSGTPFYEMFQYCKENNLDFNYLVLGIQELGNTKALFERADELSVNYFLADEIHSDFSLFLLKLEAYLSRFQHIYLSVDMDVFDVAYAPGVSSPTINGLTPYQVKEIILKIKSTNKLKLMDCVELNPIYDRDHQTSKLASHLIYNILQD